MSREINLFEDMQTEEVAETQSPSPSSSPVPHLESMPIKQWEEQQDKQQKLMRQHVKRIVEALLFASSSPIPFQKIRDVTDTVYPLKPKALMEIIQELKCEYLTQQRAFRLEEIAEGYLLRTCEEYRPYMELLFQGKRMEKLSQAALEALAIIAYKQPVTRPQIEAIRGVDSSGIIQVLLEKQLIEAVGKLEAPGRPTLFRTTTEFLNHFGLRDLEELPSMQEGAPPS